MQAGSKRYAGRRALHGGSFDSIACRPSQRHAAAHVSKRPFKVWVDCLRAGVDRLKCFTAAHVENQMLDQMMVETGEGIVRDGIVRGRVVICGLETIFQKQIRAAGPAK